MSRVFCFFLFLWGSCFAAIIEDLCPLSIETPSLGQRKSLKLRLDNGLEALLISDPGTPLSAAALAVSVGSWDDPEQFPGMAHFVEHLLFLGTEKYPEEHEYARFLDEHGGSRNACTCADRTIYMFSVANDAFIPSLDRFSQFFIAPLFNSSGISRECLAIEQEYRRNLSLDGWRSLYVRKELANRAHPFHAFCMGNLQTLEKISQEDLKAWVHSHYSSHLMHLVVYSPLALESLEKLVEEKFSPIEKREVALKKIEAPLYEAANFGKLIAIHPLQEVKQLELSWEVPKQDIDVKAAELIAYILGHEGESTLFSQLKKDDLIHGLTSSCMPLGRQQSLLTLTFTLTQKGMKEYETVIDRTFEAIASLKLSSVPRYIFDELREISSLKYRFQSREEIFDFVTEYAMALVDEDLATFPLKTLMPTQYDPEKINETLLSLTPDKCHYLLIAPKESSKIAASLEEKWLGANYAIKSVGKRRLKAWALCTPHPEMALPKPNNYLPKQLTLIAEGEAEPKLLDDSTFGKCYLAFDDSYKVPEVSWTFTFKTSAIDEKEPKSAALADLYCHMVDEALLAKSYEAATAGLRYTLEPTPNGIMLTLEGFHDKAALFLQEILETIKSAEPSKESFSNYKDLARRSYLAELKTSSLSYAAELLQGALYKNYAGALQKERALTNLSFEHFKKFSKQIWEECYVEAFLYGNLNEELGREIWRTTVAHFATKPYRKEDHVKVETACLPELHILSRKYELPSNALILAIDLGPFSFKSQAAMDILCMGIKEPFFTELRTKQQTAYFIRNWGKELERHLYAFLAVQSSSYDTRDLLARFELFLESSLRNLSDTIIPKERFASIRDALIQKLENPADNLLAKGKLLQKLAFEYEGDFGWLQKRIQAAKELTYEEFIQFAQANLGKSNRKRLAICVDGNDFDKNMHYEVLSSLEKLKKRIQYQGKHETLLPPL